nr:hypothetical protein [Tanacetum cinerariifolium]
MRLNQYSQQQQQQPNQSTGSQPQSNHQSYNLIDETEDKNEEEPIPTPTSKKTSRGSRLKAKAKKTKDTESQVEIKKRGRTVWTQDEELLMTESFIQISEDPKTGCDQQKEPFDVDGKMDSNNTSVQKFNQLVSKTLAHSGENDEDWMTRVKVLYKTHVIEQESEELRQLIQSHRIAEDMKVLQINTSEMDPVDAAIINVQKARIRAAYPPPPN